MRHLRVSLARPNAQPRDAISAQMTAVAEFPSCADTKRCSCHWELIDLRAAQVKAGGPLTITIRTQLSALSQA